MKAIDFPEKTQDLGKPEGFMDGDCISLPISRTTTSTLLISTDNEYPAIVSRWEFTDYERLAIAEGANLDLIIIGDGMPPICPIVGTAFKPASIKLETNLQGVIRKYIHLNTHEKQGLWKTLGIELNPYDEKYQTLHEVDLAFLAQVVELDKQEEFVKALMELNICR